MLPVNPFLGFLDGDYNDEVLDNCKDLGIEDELIMATFDKDIGYLIAG
jgi:hypothetical protein